MGECKTKEISAGGVWIFSGTAHLQKCIKVVLTLHYVRISSYFKVCAGFFFFFSILRGPRVDGCEGNSKKGKENIPKEKLGENTFALTPTM